MNNVSGFIKLLIGIIKDQEKTILGLQRKNYRLARRLKQQTKGDK